LVSGGQPPPHWPPVQLPLKLRPAKLWSVLGMAGLSPSTPSSPAGAWRAGST
jgi:hypothetical protein